MINASNSRLGISKMYALNVNQDLLFIIQVSAVRAHPLAICVFMEASG